MGLPGPPDGGVVGIVIDGLEISVFGVPRDIRTVMSAASLPDAEKVTATQALLDRGKTADLDRLKDDLEAIGHFGNDGDLSASHAPMSFLDGTRMRLSAVMALSGCRSTRSSCFRRSPRPSGPVKCRTVLQILSHGSIDDRSAGPVADGIRTVQDAGAGDLEGHAAPVQLPLRCPLQLPNPKSPRISRGKRPANPLWESTAFARYPAQQAACSIQHRGWKNLSLSTRWFEASGFQSDIASARTNRVHHHRYHTVRATGYYRHRVLTGNPGPPLPGAGRSGMSTRPAWAPPFRFGLFPRRRRCRQSPPPALRSAWTCRYIHWRPATGWPSRRSRPEICSGLQPSASRCAWACRWPRAPPLRRIPCGTDDGLRPSWRAIAPFESPLSIRAWIRDLPGWVRWRWPSGMAVSQFHHRNCRRHPADSQHHASIRPPFTHIGCCASLWNGGATRTFPRSFFRLSWWPYGRVPEGSLRSPSHPSGSPISHGEIPPLPARRGAWRFRARRRTRDPSS